MAWIGKSFGFAHLKNGTKERFLFLAAWPRTTLRMLDF